VPAIKKAPLAAGLGDFHHYDASVLLCIIASVVGSPIILIFFGAILKCFP
jgi:hypothetical protein